MSNMRKSEIQFHSEMYRRSHPAINVKVRGNFGPSIDSLVARFNCERDDAEHALKLLWEHAQEQFWRDISEVVKEIFPEAECYSEGRSGGWLTVHGLPYVESWSGAMVAKWSKLNRLTREEIAYLRSEEYGLEAIEANEWYKPGSEQYNFVDGPDGQPRCIVDMKRDARAAGFGPVTRE